MPARAVNVAVEEPADTSTLAGTVSAARLLESDTTAPPLPEAFDSVTVQPVVPSCPMLEGLQVTLLTCRGATSAIDAVCVFPFREAVMVAV